MVQIKNDVFCLDISETGAELTNLSIRGVNILWKRSSLWNNQSPILFPIVGQVKDGYYIYNNLTQLWSRISKLARYFPWRKRILIVKS